MPSEFERLQAELADKPAETAAPAEESKPDILEQFAAAGSGMVGAIPGGKALVAKAIGALPGHTEQSVAQQQAELARRNPGYDMAGTVGAGIGLGALTGGAGMLASAGAAAVLQPVYRLGEVANQAQAQGDPLRIEQIKHALMPDWDTLKAAGIAAAFHIPGLAVEGMSKLQETAGPMAVKAAAKLFPKAAQELGIAPEALGQMVLNKKILEDAGKLSALKDAARTTVDDIAAKTPIDMPFQEELAKLLDQQVQRNGANVSLAKELRHTQEQSAALTSRNLDGKQVQDIIQSFKEKGGKGTQAEEYYNDVAQFLHTKFADHINVVDPEAGMAYKNAVADHYTYSALSGEGLAAAGRQATVDDIKNSIGKMAVAHASGQLVGGKVGALAADLATGAMGLKSVGSKSYAVLLDRFNKSPPLATFLRKSDAVFETLLGKPSALYGAKAASKVGDFNKYYEEVSDAARQSLANPQGLAENLGTKLSFLPSHEADPIVASTVERFQEAAATLPQNDQPPTIFGIQTGPTDRQKRDWISKFEAKFDPYKAVLSGNADLIAEASKHFPETMQEIKKGLIDRVSKVDVPYSTMRQISAILGVAGVPTQDPGLAAQLQASIQNSRAAHSQQGQMDSARQQHAALKNNQATMTRANSLSKGLDEG